MTLDITSPMCGESGDLGGERHDEAITITCGGCGQSWERPTTPVSPRATEPICSVPLAIVEKSRGTQLSVVGIRIIQLCRRCDAEDI